MKPKTRKKVIKLIPFTDPVDAKVARRDLFRKARNREGIISVTKIPLKKWA